MPSSSAVLALSVLVLPQLCTRPWSNTSCTSRGCVAPRARTKASTSAARRSVAASQARFGDARMHQRQQAARHEAVVDEAVLLDVQPRIAALEIARAIALDAMAQRQVLRARRRADRVGLHEAEAVDRLLQRGRRKQRAGDGVAAQVVERDGFGAAHGLGSCRAHSAAALARVDEPARAQPSIQSPPMPAASPPSPPSPSSQAVTMDWRLLAAGLRRDRRGPAAARERRAQRIAVPRRQRASARARRRRGRCSASPASALSAWIYLTAFARGRARARRAAAVGHRAGRPDGQLDQAPPAVAAAATSRSAPGT